MDNQQVITASAGITQELRLAVFRLPVQAGLASVAATRVAKALEIAGISLSFILRNCSMPAR